jgi:putative membrane protein
VLPTLVVALALLVGGASLLLRLREREETRDARDVDADEGAVSVLRARYARGEIDDDEFDRRRARLEGGRAPPESSS